MRKLTLVNHILKVRPNTLLSKDDITDHKVNEAYQKQFPPDTINLSYSFPFRVMYSVIHGLDYFF
jgi:hypothetical protein